MPRSNNYQMGAEPGNNICSAERRSQRSPVNTILSWQTREHKRPGRQVGSSEAKGWADVGFPACHPRETKLKV